jgi:hypothetical protein
VSVKVRPPTSVEAGLKLVMTGLTGSIVKVFAADFPSAVTTVTLAEIFAFPELNRSGAVTDGGRTIFVAVTPVGIIVVVLVEVFHNTCAPVTKLLPLIVKVRSGLPAMAEVGLRAERTGLGSKTNVAAADVPFAVVTVTAAVPAVLMSALGTVALIADVLPEVTVRVEVAPVVVFLHFTVLAFFMKFAPLMVSANAGPPGVTARGLRLVISGFTGSIVKVFAADVPAAVITVTLAETFAFPESTRSGAVTDGGKVIACEVNPVGVIFLVVVEVFHSTCVPLMKLLPLIVRVRSGSPAMAEAGLKDEMTGLGSKVNVAAGEVPPAVVVTVTDTAPAVSTSDFGTVTLIVEAVSEVIGSVEIAPVDVFFHFTVVAFFTKSAPSIVSVNPGPPGATDAGLRLVISGFCASMVNEVLADFVPTLETVTAAIPLAPIRLAGTVAVRSLELSNLVTSSRSAQYTFDSATKFLPSTVSVKDGQPAWASAGINSVMVGAAAMAGGTKIAKETLHKSAKNH